MQKKQLLEVIVRNPTPETVTLEAQIEGRDLTGPSSITLNPGDKDVYTLQYAPAIIGKTMGRYVKSHNIHKKKMHLCKQFSNT